MGANSSWRGAGKSTPIRDPRHDADSTKTDCLQCWWHGRHAERGRCGGSGALGAWAPGRRR